MVIRVPTSCNKNPKSHNRIGYLPQCHCRQQGDPHPYPYLSDHLHSRHYFQLLQFRFQHSLSSYYYVRLDLRRGLGLYRLSWIASFHRIVSFFWFHSKLRPFLFPGTSHHLLTFISWGWGYYETAYFLKFKRWTRNDDVCLFKFIRMEGSLRVRMYVSRVRTCPALTVITQSKTTSPNVNVHGSP